MLREKNTHTYFFLSINQTVYSCEVTQRTRFKVNIITDGGVTGTHCRGKT